MNVLEGTPLARKTFTEADLVPYPTWIRSNTGEVYTVLGVAASGEKGNKERYVIYFNHSFLHRYQRRQLLYCEISEFLDGRFKPVLSSCERI